MRFCVRRCFFLPIAFGTFCFAASVSTGAQTLTHSTRPALNDWHGVQALPAQTRIRLVTDRKKITCFLDSVTEDHLVCTSSSSKGGSQTGFARDEIKEIELLHRSRSHSTATGAFLGLGVGGGVGALVGVAINSGLAFHTTTAKAAGAGAAVGAGAGVIAGAAIGSAKDWGASSTVVYRRP